MNGRARGLLRPVLPALVVALLSAATAQAETRTFLNTQNLFPLDGAGTVGPANHYPSTIVVDGLAGTVTKATVTLLGYESSRPDDADVVIAGPNGQNVMLMSDSCGTGPIQNDNWTFDDTAPTFVSNGGPCANYEETSYMPSNYLGSPPEPDDLSPGGGPAGPYLNALSFFAGASPNGAWRLFVVDDEAGFFGFGLSGWALTLELEPPPPDGGAPGDATAPQTTIGASPKDKTKQREATFEFSSNEAGSTFNCVLDGKQQFKPCTSPLTIKVKRGKHTFSVTATDAAGNADPTPATDSWKVKKKK